LSFYFAVGKMKTAIAASHGRINVAEQELFVCRSWV